MARGGDDVPVADEHFTDWLAASPCRFARAFAKREAIRPVEFLDPFVSSDVASLNSFLDECAKA